MSEKDTQELPAFPTSFTDNEGMTLRDYFAAAALQGMYAGNALRTDGDLGGYAESAYQIADAMIAERAK